MPLPVPTDDRRTLRDFGFTECEHPQGSLAQDTERQHCGFCGATRTGRDTYKGGSCDYKIDLVLLKVFRAKLAANTIPQEKD